MSYRDHLPQLDGDLFLTDGGIETTLIFHDGLDLPAFAAFDLLKDEEGTRGAAALLRAVRGARRASAASGFVLESPTWRASPAGPPSSATASRSSTRSTARRSP